MIRPGKPEDCGAAYGLICGMEERALPRDAFEALFQAQREDPRHQMLVAEEDGQVIAFLNLRVEGQLHHAGFIAEILELAVSPACRGRGVGAALVEAACQTARERGCGQIEVACNQLRRDAHRFYLRAGLKNCHYKFSMGLNGPDAGENALGR